MMTILILIKNSIGDVDVCLYFTAFINGRIRTKNGYEYIRKQMIMLIYIMYTMNG